MGEGRWNEEAYIVSRMRVLVRAPEKGSRRVGAYSVGEQLPAARVLVQERRHVVDEARDEDERPVE